MFYTFKVGEKYVGGCKSLKLKLVKNVNNADYWTSKKTLNSWVKFIKNKYPDAVIVEMVLKEKTK